MMLALQYVRSAFFSFFVLPFTTLFICVLGVPFMFAPRRIFMKLVKFWISVVSFLERHVLGLHYEVRGLEHLPEDGQCIIAAKHQSTYETFKIHSLFKDPAIILKRELLWIPIWGWYMAKSDVIAINRSSPDQAVETIRAGSQRVAAQKRPIILFPQGTRVRPGVGADVKPYKSGVYRIHEYTGLPVIPLATNSGCFWPKGSLLKKPGTVVFEFLPALPHGLERKVFMAELEQRLEEASNTLIKDAEIKL